MSSISRRLSRAAKSVRRVIVKAVDSIRRLFNKTTDAISNAGKSVTNAIQYAVNSVKYRIKLTIANLLVRNYVMINSRYASGKNYWKAFTTAQKARRFRAEYNMNMFDESNRVVELIIPEYIAQMTPLWFASVMYPSYYKLGEEAFKKYKWKIAFNTEGGVGRIKLLKEQLQIGIEYCRGLKEKGYCPDSSGEIQTMENKYSFDEVSIVQLLKDWIKPRISRMKKSIQTWIHIKSVKLSRMVDYPMYLNLTGFFVPFALALIYPNTWIPFIGALTACIAIHVFDKLRVKYASFRYA